MQQSFDLLSTDTSLNANEEIMLQAFSILTSATVEVKQGKTGELIPEGLSFFTHLCSEKIIKQLSGKKEVDQALQKLHNLISAPKIQNSSADLIRLGDTPALVGEPRTLF